MTLKGGLFVASAPVKGREEMLVMHKISQKNAAKSGLEPLNPTGSPLTPALSPSEGSREKNRGRRLEALMCSLGLRQQLSQHSGSIRRANQPVVKALRFVTELMRVQPEHMKDRR